MPSGRQLYSLLALLYATTTAYANEETTAPTELPILLTLGLKLNGEDNQDISVNLQVRAGQSTHEAVYLFGQEHNVDAGSLINLKRQLDTKAHQHTDPTVKDQVCTHPIAKQHTTPPSQLIAKANTQILKGQYLKAAQNLLHAVPSDGTQQPASDALAASLDTVIRAARMEKDLEEFECKQQKYVDVLHKLMEASPKSGSFPLKLAECHAERGDFSLALQTTASVLKATGSKKRWKDTQPRTKAVLLAHRMSLELGDIEAASKKLSVALRADPANCGSITGAFATLKKIRKSVKSAKKDLKKTYNKRALGHLETAMELAAVYNLTTNVLKGKLMLDLCSAMARVRRHEQALIVCNEAIDLTNITMDGLFMDTGQLASAFIARGESLVADYDYKEAVRDFRNAGDIAGQGEIQNSARQKQQNAEWKAKEGEKNPERIKILGLPVNIESIGKKRKCEWLKKSFKKMVLKWHPDKNKGNPGRGSRKFEEITGAKKWLANQWGCKARRRL